jgi:Na+/H+-dicarboxylate symporter
MSKEITLNSGEAARRPGKKRMGLGEKVLIGFVLGLVVGVFFGEMIAFLKIAGDAFIMLLQMTVIPYITVSLITALGRLTIEDAKSLSLKAGGVLLVLWGICLAVVLLSTLAFPQWPSASFFSTSQVEEAKSIDFLQLYIPANPFYAMANAIVPAIVLFSVLIGLATIGINSKEALLKPLSAVADALMGVTEFVARLAPYGVFALTASAAGTIDLEEINRLQIYVVMYTSITLILGFWVLPALVSTVTPLGYGSIIRAFRGTLIAAFATGSLLVVLPMLAVDIKKLIEQKETEKNSFEETEARSPVDVLIPVAYNFPNLGNVLTLIFVLFAGWFIGTSVPVSQFPVLSTAGIASLFGGPVLAIPFLLDLLELPQDLFQLYIAVDVLIVRFATVLAAMHLATIALIGTFSMLGKTRLRWLPLARFTGITIVLLAVTLGGIRMFYTHVIVAPYTKNQVLQGLQLLTDPQPAKVYTNVPTEHEFSGGGPTSLEEIKERGVLRVCFLRNDYPSAFFNSADPPQLVGFDIEMSHRFARNRKLALEFLPADDEMQAAQLLNTGSCDILMGSLPISAGRFERFAMSSPIYKSSVGLIVPDHLRDSFQTWDEVRNLGASLRLAIQDTPEARALAVALMPEAKLVPIKNEADNQRILESGAKGVDAIADMAEEGAAWTLLYPEFSLVVPKPAVFMPVGYAVAHGNEKLLKVFDAWLIAEKSMGTIDALYNYWMLGEAAKTKRPPRWSVIRDVLHWVE